MEGTGGGIREGALAGTTSSTDVAAQLRALVSDDDDAFEDALWAVSVLMFGIRGTIYDGDGVRRALPCRHRRRSRRHAGRFTQDDLAE